MASLAFGVVLAFLLVLFGGIVYAMMDQVNMGNFLTFAQSQKLNGTYQNIYVWLWALIPIAITLHIIVGLYAQSHFSRNEID